MHVFLYRAGRCAPARTLSAFERCADGGRDAVSDSGRCAYACSSAGHRRVRSGRHVRRPAAGGSGPEAADPGAGCDGEGTAERCAELFFRRSAESGKQRPVWGGRSRHIFRRQADHPHQG